ncbi:MAG: DUF4190 domain-containing protein [Lysobacteraceae bacterium]
MNSPVPFRQTNTLAIVSLVAGILSWILAPFLGPIVAIITGHMARKEIRNAPDRYEGDGLAIGGLILGYAQLAMIVLGVLVLFLFFGGLAALATFAR